MPSKSPAQKRLMQAVAHNPEFAAKVGIPQSVGREFNNADQAKKKAADRMKAIQSAARKGRKKG